MELRIQHVLVAKVVHCAASHSAPSSTPARWSQINFSLAHANPFRFGLLICRLIKGKQINKTSV